MESFKDRLVDILVKGKVIKEKDLAKALEIQKQHGSSKRHSRRYMPINQSSILHRTVESSRISNFRIGNLS